LIVLKKIKSKAYTVYNIFKFIHELKLKLIFMLILDPGNISQPLKCYRFPHLTTGSSLVAY